MVGLTPRLCLLLPGMLHPAGRPSSSPTWPFHRQCVGEAGRAGSSLRVTLPPGVSPLSRGFRSGGLTLLPSLPWGHAAAPAGAATAAGTSATADCRPSLLLPRLLPLCRFVTSRLAACLSDRTARQVSPPALELERLVRAASAAHRHQGLNGSTQPSAGRHSRGSGSLGSRRCLAWCHPPASTGTEHPYHGGHTPPRWHARASPYSVTNRARRASECARPAPY